MKTGDYHQQFRTKWRSWPYKNTFLLMLSLAVFWYFADNHLIRFSIKIIGDLGYIGAFAGGAMFVSSFTIAPATIIIFDISKVLNPIAVAFFAGCGAMIGDYILFRYMRDRVFEELAPVFNKMAGNWLKKLFNTPYFVWLIPFLGALVVASPLPDEIGISMLGFSKIKIWQFVLITFLLNALGIFLTILLAESLQTQT